MITMPLPVASSVAPSYVPRLSLWSHQQDALAKLMDHRNFALFMEMRTGKTATILAEFGNLVAELRLDSLLVVAPAGVYRVWDADARKHLAADLRGKTKIHIWSAADHDGAVTEIMSWRGPRILLVNVEALSSVKRVRQLCADYLKQRPAMMVIDESTAVKNPRAKRTKFIVDVLAPLAARRRILSGLPTPQSPLDLYAQFAFLNPRILNYPSFTGFRARYTNLKRVPFGPGGTMIDIVTGYKNLDELAATIAPHSFRVRLEDCYDLPPKIYMRREVAMTVEQRRIYDELRDYATACLGNEERVTATMVLTAVLRLHQVLCGHTTSDDGTEMVIKENRTDELLQIIEDQPVDRKAIIWVSYDHDVTKVARALAMAYDPACVVYSLFGEERSERREPKFPSGIVARFWGGNVDTREEEERRFKEDPRCRFMVATPSSGGRGRTWDGANLVVYYSNTWNLEHRLQSEERPQAVGKTTSVAYVDLICPGTVEEKIVAALREKINIAAVIAGDDYREWLI